MDNLKNPDLFQAHHSKCENIAGTEKDDIDMCWKELSDKITKAATETLVIQKIGGTRKRRTPWWNETVKDSIKCKNKAYRRWMKAKYHETRLRYVQQRNKANNIMRKAKKESWESLAKDLNEDNKSSKKRVYKLTKSMRKPQQTRTVFKDEAGKMTSDPNKIAAIWTQHFETLLNVHHTVSTSTVSTEFPNNGLETPEEVPKEDITMQELDALFKKMKPAKTTGPDGIPVELLQHANTKNHYLNIFNKAWSQGKIPSEWGKSIICPIYKKGDHNNCGNYRGISLMPHACKLYERILE